MAKKFIHHNGFTFKLKCERTKSTLYWCTLNRRNVSDCSAKLRVFKATGVQEMIGTYSQTCNHRKKSSLVSSSALVDITNLQSQSKKIVLDYTDDMREKVITLAIPDVSIRPSVIWKTISNQTNSRFTTWKGMTDVQVKNLVFNTRSKENGGDVYRLLERPSLCMVQNFNFFFLQSNQTIINVKIKNLRGL